MTTAFKLIAKVMSFRLPPRALIFGLLNKTHYLLKTGNRRFEFERLYLENPDPWDCESGLYEHDKYERTFACALKWQHVRASALEVGCGTGVFSEMLARHFGKVTAIDV